MCNRNAARIARWQNSFFRGSQYIQDDIATGRADPGSDAAVDFRGPSSAALFSPINAIRNSIQLVLSPNKLPSVQLLGKVQSTCRSGGKCLPSSSIEPS